MFRLINNKLVLLVMHILLLPHVLAYYLCVKKSIIDQDVIRMNSHRGINLNGSFGLLYLLLVNPFYRNVFYLRIGRFSHMMAWMLPRAKYFYPCKDIGGGVFLAHPYATIINAKSVGSNFSVRQCTTIGNKRDGDGRNGPVIGNNVSVGANVCIIGDISIGDNVIIGAGSVVVNDIPDNCVIVGNPARIINSVNL